VAEGAHVFIFGRRKAELDAAVTANGGHVTAVQDDVTKLSDLDRLYSAVKVEKGKLDIVFANAAMRFPFHLPRHSKFFENIHQLKAPDQNPLPIPFLSVPSFRRNKWS
jgi:NAD(P)-dependent dehydrogenase (short-subunit alcohol dehydrogenase family)